MIDLSTPVLGPVDISARSLVQAFRRHNVSLPYPDLLLQRLAEALVADCATAGVRPSIVAGQIAHETGWFSYTGDVKADQYNFAGLGATGGGVPGHRFPSPEAGIRAVVAHHLGYCLGAAHHWPEATLEMEEGIVPWFYFDPRYTALINSGRSGTVTVLGDYGNGNWAQDPDYAEKIAGYANQIVGAGFLKVALAAGHHNRDGGNATEYRLVGELTEAYALHLKLAGADVRVITPDGPDADTSPGDGAYPGGLQDVARRVVEWAGQGWVADLFIELHTEGVALRGVFGVYPDWGDDYDEGADNLGFEMALNIRAAVGIPLRGMGIMSEQATAVGRGGSRLGVFLATAPIKATTTRLIM